MGYRDTSDNGEVNSAETCDLPEEVGINESESLPEEVGVNETDNLPEEVESGYHDDSMLAALNKRDSSDTGDQINKEESETSSNSDVNTLTMEEKQEIANRTAAEYNAKYRPYERAVEAGIEGVEQTENGGVSFANTNDIYVKDDGTRCVVVIEATGNRPADFDRANELMGLEETPEGYVWHHVDDYNVKDGTVTLELVKQETHNITKPHSGGCAMYDSVNGPSYNRPKKEVQDV